MRVWKYGCECMCRLVLLPSFKMKWVDELFSFYFVFSTKNSYICLTHVRRFQLSIECRCKNFSLKGEDSQNHDRDTFLFIFFLLYFQRCNAAVKIVSRTINDQNKQKFAIQKRILTCSILFVLFSQAQIKNNCTNRHNPVRLSIGLREGNFFNFYFSFKKLLWNRSAINESLLQTNLNFKAFGQLMWNNSTASDL